MEEDHANNQPEDLIFASMKKKGKQPYWPDTILTRCIRPAAIRAGITKRIGWHTFRHTFATLLKGNKEEVKVVQELMRHASARMTLDVYAQAVTPEKRRAQSRVAAMLRERVEENGGGNVIGPFWTFAHFRECCK